MKKKLFTLLTLLLCLCSGAWADPVTLINQSNGNVNSTDFRCTSTSSTKSGGYTIGSNSYEKYIQLGGAFTTPIGAYEQNKIIQYDAKTNSVTVDVYAFNISSSTDYKLYISMIEEGDTKAADIDIQEFTVGKNSGDKFSYTFIPTTNATIYVHVGNNTNVHICQVEVTDNGATTLKQGGEIGYTANLTLCRLGLDKKTASMDGMEFKTTNNNVKVLTSGNPVKLKSTSEYIKFTLSKTERVTINASGTYSVTTSDSYQSASPKSDNQTLTLDAGTYYVCPNGSNVTFASISFLAPPTLYTITYENAADAAGVVPEAKGNLASGTKITLPKNFTMYKEGFTMTGWDANGDGIADYSPGAEYTVTDNATLTAVFESNDGTTLDDRLGATAIKFEFQQGQGAPSTTWSSGDHFWVAQATVAGKTIDVKADIAFGDGQPKFDNSAWNDWAQINANTTFTIPSANGASVEMISYNQDENTTVAGTALTSTGSESNYTCTADLTSDASTADVAFSGAGSYYKYIKVTLPGPTYDVDFTLTNVTKSTGDATVEGGTQYTATFAAADGYGLPASVTVTAGGTDISSNCTWASGTLTIPAAYVTGDIAITIDGVAIAGSTIIKATMSSASSATPSGTLAGSVSASTQNGNGSPDSNGGYKFGSGGHYIGLTLATGNTFMAGDVINVHTTTASGQGTIAIYDTDKSTVLYDTGTPGVAGDNKFVLPAAVNGKSAIYVCRVNKANNWNGYVDFIEVTRPNAAITLNNVSGAAYGFSTFCSPNNFTVTGATAYKASLDKGKLTLTALEGIIPANAGVILAADKGATASIAYTTSDATADMDGNALGGTTARTLTASLKGDNTYFYAFQNTTNTFKQYTGEYFPANKAYVVSNAQLSRGISMDFGETTGISNVDVNANDNFDLNAPMYNLAGQKVGKSYKGIVIVNGKKYVRK